MNTERAGQSQWVQLNETIKHKIMRRTGGRIRTLEVESIDDSVVIRGIVPCYYLKQLVLDAALELIGSAGATRIELNVQVVCSPGNPVESQAYRVRRRCR